MDVKSNKNIKNRSCVEYVTKILDGNLEMGELVDFETVYINENFSGCKVQIG